MLCASNSLDEVIQLWDFLLAYGVHLNILCVIAQLFNMRTEIMESSSFVSLSLGVFSAYLLQNLPNFYAC